MRRTSKWLAVLLTLGLARLPGTASAQEYAPPDAVFPFPLYHTRPEAGGFYAAAEFVLFRQTNALRNQPVAFRGFVDADGSISGRVGRFIGGGQLALNTKDASGPATYQPGTQFAAGWKFANQMSFEVSWWQLSRADYSASANLIPPRFENGPNLENTFLFSPVFNFPADFAGPPRKLNPAIGNPFATFGIWNAASQMQIFFRQRTDQYEATFRVPVYQNDYYRAYGLVGPRVFWIWERFRWRTVDIDSTTGQSNPTTDVAIYNNIVSNRMYGVHIGCGQECWLGHGLSASLDLQAALLLDVAYERATFRLGQMFEGPTAKRRRYEYTVVPELQANANLWWYPIEGVQVRVGYNLMAFFNTVAAPTPIAFDFGGLDPPWEKGIFRFFDGLNVGIGFIF